MGGAGGFYAVTSAAETIKYEERTQLVHITLASGEEYRVVAENVSVACMGGNEYLRFRGRGSDYGFLLKDVKSYSVETIPAGDIERRKQEVKDENFRNKCLTFK